MLNFNSPAKLLLLILLIISPLFLFQCGTSKVPKTSEGTSDLTPLALYGKKIFEKENCLSCHVLNVNENTSSKSSLDGIGGKYADMYLFHLLTNPVDFVFNGYMPEYFHLFEKIDSEDFKKTIDPSSNLNVKEFDGIWKSLDSEIDSSSVEILGDDLRKTELQALVAFIQTIKPSPYQRKLDREETRKAEKRIAKYSKAWDSQRKDNYQDVLSKANDIRRISDGKKLYQSKCAVCHLENGEGAIGPNLTDDYWISGGNDYQVLESIIVGNPDKGMIPFIYELMPEEASNILAFLKSIRGTNPPNGKSPQGTKE